VAGTPIIGQLSLACDGPISQRDHSFVVSGRSPPTREMVMLLAQQLSVPLRERNAPLVAARFASVYSKPTSDDPTLGLSSEALQLRAW